MAYRPVELRPNVVPGHRLAKLVLSKRCLHLDFWIEGATLFLQARTGGRELLSSHAWDIATCMEINATSTGEDQCFTNSKDPVKRQIAARAHELIVKPLLAEPTPEPFTMRSVCLHYVQFQRLDPITPDMMNFWKAGRGVRRGKPQRTTWGDVGGRLPDVL